MLDVYRNLNKGSKGCAVWSVRAKTLVVKAGPLAYRSWLLCEGVTLGYAGETRRDGWKTGSAFTKASTGARAVYAWMRCTAVSAYEASDLAAGDVDFSSPVELREYALAQGFRYLTCDPKREGHFVWGDTREAAPRRLAVVVCTPFGAWAKE
mgnify:CR=1 FL=1